MRTQKARRQQFAPKRRRACMISGANLNLELRGFSPQLFYMLQVDADMPYGQN